MSDWVDKCARLALNGIAIFVFGLCMAGLFFFLHNVQAVWVFLGMATAGALSFAGAFLYVIVRSYLERARK